MDIGQLESLVPGFGSAAPVIGTNVDGGSVLTNFFNANQGGQFFWMVTGHAQYEKPSSLPVVYNAGIWCSDLTFTDFESGIMPMGYTGHCLSFTLDEVSKFVSEYRRYHFFTSN